VDDLVVVPWGGPRRGPWISLAAYDAHSGEVVWTGGNRQISYSSPTLATLCGVRQILLVSESHAGGYDPQTGRLLWETDWPGDSSGNASVSQPVAVGNDRVLLTKGYSIGAKLLRISRAESTAGDWQVDELWSNPKVLLTKFSNVVVRDGYVYGLSDSILECTRWEDGKRRWKSGRYGQGQLLGVGPWLLIQSESGQVVLMAADPRGPEELASLPALEGKTWNNPCLYGRFLLVRNAEQAACYELAPR
jgi:outer membrane protein assembly factor BamB